MSEGYVFDKIHEYKAITRSRVFDKQRALCFENGDSRMLTNDNFMILCKHYEALNKKKPTIKNMNDYFKGKYMSFHEYDFGKLIVHE